MVMLFYSSRRRHTRYIGDWSSDVCSSDLCVSSAGETALLFACVCSQALGQETQSPQPKKTWTNDNLKQLSQQGARSEERRVGKESRAGRAEEAAKDIRGDMGGMSDRARGM